jgi:hypothetical protein
MFSVTKFLFFGLFTRGIFAHNHICLFRQLHQCTRIPRLDCSPSTCYVPPDMYLHNWESSTRDFDEASRSDSDEEEEEDDEEAEYRRWEPEVDAAGNMRTPFIPRLRAGILGCMISPGYYPGLRWSLDWRQRLEAGDAEFVEFKQRVESPDGQLFAQVEQVYEGCLHSCLNWTGGDDSKFF